MTLTNISVNWLRALTKMDETLKKSLLAISVIYLISVLQHIFFPSHYSDIGSLYWRDVVPTQHSIPYINYPLEYPILIGVLIYISGFFWHDVVLYLLTMGVFLYPFAIGLVILLYRLCEMFKVNYNRIFFFFIFTPSMLHFAFYNWDLIPVFFSVAAIYFYLLKKERLSAVSLGLGITSKFYPATLLPIFLASNQNWRKRVELILISLGFFAIINLPFAIVNFDMWWRTYTWQATSVETSWWRLTQLPPFNLPVDWQMKTLEVIMFLGLTVLALRSKTNIPQRAWLMSAFFFLSYTGIPPQFSMILLPYWTFISVPLAYFYLFEMLNAMIIIFWFTFVPPFAPLGPVQIIAYTRQFLLIPIILYLLHPQIKIRDVWKWLKTPIRPLEEEPKEVLVEEKIVKKPVKILPKIKKMVTFLVSPIEEEIEEEK